LQHPKDKTCHPKSPEIKKCTPIFCHVFSGFKGAMISPDRNPCAQNNYRHFGGKIEEFNDEEMGCFYAEIIMRLTIKKFNSPFKWFNGNSIAERKN
jgi:hypothetical protein